MIIALDYDGTYTADPDFWDTMIAAAEARGHQVRCVTMRFPHEAIPAIPCEIVYTGRRAKVAFMAERQERIDVWIDDNPIWLLTNAA